MEANASFLPIVAVFTHARSYLRADTALPVGAVFNRARFFHMRADTARLLGSCCVHLNVCIISTGRRGF